MKAALIYLLLIAACAFLPGCSGHANETVPASSPAGPGSSTVDSAQRAQLQGLKGKLLDAGLSVSDREEAGVELARSKEGGDILLNLASHSKIPAELMPALSEAIFRNPDFAVRALASQHFKRASVSNLPPVNELVQIKGDAARGKSIFFSATASCFKCHSFGGKGGDFGPDLTQVQAKLARDTLFDAILNPSASIMFGYEAWMIETKEGESYTGLIVSEGENLVLKTGSGQTVSIPCKNIVLRQQQSLSLMPDNIALGLSAQDLADLAEFLLTKQ